MSQAAIRLWPELADAVISPMIYGHFAEHLGRCIYEGIWVGPKSRIPNEKGMRLDVLAALKHLRAPILRWPGGCFADDYHWRQGVGPKKDRPATVNLWWQQTDPNSFGTQEYMKLCQALGCDANICVNVGSGSPREARDWLEYCNFGGDSALSKARAKHGHPEPYGVRYWGVGNEPWGCGGRFTGGDYGKEYVRFANYMKQMDPEIELIAAGTHFGDYSDARLNAFNHDFCASMPHADLIEHLSIHRYFARGKGDDFSENDYKALFADVHTLEKDLQLTEAVLRYFYPDKHVGIAVDEWGMWHPEATPENGLEQTHTLRDALLAASVLNLFNRWAHRVSMANIAQTVNVLQCLAMTNGVKMFLTPTYYVFDMMRPHMNGKRVTQQVECDNYEAHPVGEKEKASVSLLDVSASRSGKRLHLTVVNRSLDQDIETEIEVKDLNIKTASGSLLHAESPQSANTFEQPRSVRNKRFKLQAEASKPLIHVFPAHSVTAIALTLE